jgi:hypothetical protein
MQFSKAGPEAGSALRAAGELHGSADVHAIRYGDRGTPGYRRAYSEHVGRFLSCMRDFQRGSMAKRFMPPAGADQAASYAVGYLLRQAFADPVIQKRYASVLARGVLDGNDSMALRDQVNGVLVKSVELPASVDKAEVAARVHRHLRDRLNAEAAAVR